VLCLVVWYDLFCRVVCFLELLLDDDISPFIDVLDDFHAVDVVELWMIDDYLLMYDYIGILLQKFLSYQVGVHFYHILLHHKP